MPANTSNPYQPPAVQPPEVQPALSVAGVLDDVLKTGDRVEFETVLTESDQYDAVRRTKMRADLQRLRWFRWMLVHATGLISLIAVLRGLRTGQMMMGLPFYLLIAASSLTLYVFLIGRWMTRQHVQMNRDALGKITGWMDHETLWIENERQTRCRPLNQLVGVAKNQRQLALCFDSTHSLFETLPGRGFNDPDTFQILADNLAQVRPYSAAIPFDSRRLEPPTDDPRFEPGEDAVFYSGPLHRQDIKNTPLEGSQRRAKLMMAGQLTVFIGICVGLIFLVSPAIEFQFIALAVVGLLFLQALYRVGQASFAGQADRDVFWQSAGWLDQSGIVSMTVLGQTKSQWSAFDQAAITDRVISIRTASGSLWHLTGRDQFAEESQWDAACKIVREHLPAT